MDARQGRIDHRVVVRNIFLYDRAGCHAHPAADPNRAADNRIGANRHIFSKRRRKPDAGPRMGMVSPLSHHRICVQDQIASGVAFKYNPNRMRNIESSPYSCRRMQRGTVYPLIKVAYAPGNVALVTRPCPMGYAEVALSALLFCKRLTRFLELLLVRRELQSLVVLGKCLYC
jgi:hypothetical protein